MSGGGSDNPAVFNEEELFSFRRITLAPFMVILGYGLVLFGIMKKQQQFLLDYLTALILGIVQGLTEFLPVSSSGHLEITKEIFNTGYEAKETLQLSRKKKIDVDIMME